jgi:hypothetical protein
MKNVNEIKDKAYETLGNIIEKSGEIYSKAGETAKYLARTAVLKAELAKEKTKLKTLYSDLGSLYFTLHKDAPEDPLAQTCDTIKDIIKNIEIKESELEALNQDYDPDASDAGFTSAEETEEPFDSDSSK